MRGRCLRAFLLAATVLLAPPAMSGTITTDSVCFEHIGVQDKPMPEFCITAAAPPGTAALAAHDSVVVDRHTVRRVIEVCAAAPMPGTAAVSGNYRANVLGAIPRAFDVGPATMRTVLDLLSDHYSRIGKPPPEVLIQTMRRLGPS